MDTYFSIVPQDIINLFIVTVNEPKQFIDFLDQWLTIKNKTWEFIFSLRFNEESGNLYQDIKKMLSIDQTLRTPRYTKNWKELYINFIKGGITSIYHTFSYPYFLLIPEIENLIYSAKLYQDFPQFYNKSIKLPGLFNKERIYTFLSDLDKEIVYGDIRDKNFINYFETGKLTKTFFLSSVRGLPVELILWMIQDLPDIIKNNEIYIREELLSYRYGEDGDRNLYFVEVMKLITPLLPEELVKNIRESSYGDSIIYNI